MYHWDNLLYGASVRKTWTKDPHHTTQLNAVVPLALQRKYGVDARLWSLFTSQAGSVD